MAGGGGGGEERGREREGTPKIYRYSFERNIYYFTNSCIFVRFVGVPSIYEDTINQYLNISKYGRDRYWYMLKILPKTIHNHLNLYQNEIRRRDENIPETKAHRGLHFRHMFVSSF